jgi:hypothetical protein
MEGTRMKSPSGGTISACARSPGAAPDGTRAAVEVPSGQQRACPPASALLPGCRRVTTQSIPRRLRVRELCNELPL